MPTLLVASCKGGTGKSTTACSLAVYFAQRGLDVMLLDADPQRTSARFVERRNETGRLPEVHCVQKTGNLVKTVRDLAKRYSLVIADVGGRHESDELTTGLACCDLAYTPVRPSQADLETLAHFERLVHLAQGFNPELSAHVLINQAPTHYLVTEAREAKAFIAGFGTLQLSPCVLHDRKAYRDALSEGEGVTERDTPARAEIQLLGQEIYTQLF